MWRSILTVLVGLATVAFGGSAWQVRKPIQQGRLTIFPVTGESQPETGRYLTLDEGLEAGTVKVGEMGSLAR